MEPYHGRYLYQEFLTVPSICWFDEDWKRDNIHSIFLESGSKVYCESLEFNPSQKYAQFVQRDYSSEDRKYHEVRYKRALYFWYYGNILQITYNGKNSIKANEFMYMHFQSRPMLVRENNFNTEIIQILPNEFDLVEKLPVNAEEWNEFKYISISAYLFVFSNQWKRITRKLKKFFEFS